MQQIAFSRDHLAHSRAIGASLLGLVVVSAGGLANDLDCSVEVRWRLFEPLGTNNVGGAAQRFTITIWEYFNGNPATLNPLPPVEAAAKYVAAMGGPDAVMKLGREAYQNADYRWGAELMNHLVFAQPDNQEAKNLQADILESRWQGWGGRGLPDQ